MFNNGLFLDVDLSCRDVVVCLSRLETPELSFLQRRAEKPCLDDVTGVGNVRQGFHIAALLLVLFTLLPVFPEMAEELGIGINHMVM